MPDTVEIGLGRSARRGYHLDEIALVPTRRTRGASMVSLAWQIDAHHFDLPLITAPSDAVVSPRTVALIEAVSFLLLLGVAMPLKYAAGMPIAVTVAGWIHGVLFVAFIIALVRTVGVARWPLARTAMVFVGALLPFGPMVLEPRMRRYQAEFSPRG